jgi:glutaredoxin
MAAVLGVIAFLCFSAIAYTALRRAMASGQPELQAESSVAYQDPSASGAPEPELAEAPDNERSEPEPDPFADAAAAFDTPAAAPSPSPTAEALAAAPPSALAPSSSAPSASSTAAAEQLRMAMQRVPVTLYTTTWCKHCERARVWMRANSIPFVERDVEASESAERARRALNPAGGVPTIDIDGQILVGFHEASVLRALLAAAQRRMR